MTYRCAVHGLESAGIASGRAQWTCDGCGLVVVPDEGELSRIRARLYKAKDTRGPAPSNWLAIPNGDGTSKHFCKECKALRRPAREVTK